MYPHIVKLITSNTPSNHGSRVNTFAVGGQRIRKFISSTPLRGSPLTLSPSYSFFLPPERFFHWKGEKGEESAACHHGLARVIVRWRGEAHTRKGWNEGTKARARRMRADATIWWILRGSPVSTRPSADQYTSAHTPRHTRGTRMSRIVRTVTRVTLCERVNVHEPLCTRISGRIQESVNFTWNTGTRGGAVHARSTFRLDLCSLYLYLSLSFSSSPIFFSFQFLISFVPISGKVGRIRYSISTILPQRFHIKYNNFFPPSFLSRGIWTYIVESDGYIFVYTYSLRVK